MEIFVFVNGEEVTEAVSLAETGGLVLFGDEEGFGHEGTYWVSEVEMGLGLNGEGYRLSDGYLDLGSTWIDWESIFEVTGVDRDDAARAKVVYGVYRYYKDRGDLELDVTGFEDAYELREGTHGLGVYNFL